jgi:LacI family transcriptional regulator
MAGRKMKNERIVVEATHVVTRQSTDVMAIEDDAVAQAVHFIRYNCTKPVQVTDVADAVFLSRSSLERRFRKATGRSVLQEIRRVRVEQIVQLLLETNMSITAIAQRMNFTGIEHIGRYFRQEKGMSPLAYRKRFREFM